MDVLGPFTHDLRHYCNWHLGMGVGSSLWRQRSKTQILKCTCTSKRRCPGSDVMQIDKTACGRLHCLCLQDVVFHYDQLLIPWVAISVSDMLKKIRALKLKVKAHGSTYLFKMGRMLYSFRKRIDRYNTLKAQQLSPKGANKNKPCFIPAVKEPQTSKEKRNHGCYR